MCVCVCVCVCVRARARARASMVYHFDLENIYSYGVWNKPFEMDDSLSVIRSVEVMSDNVRT